MAEVAAGLGDRLRAAGYVAVTPATRSGRPDATQPWPTDRTREEHHATGRLGVLRRLFDGCVDVDGHEAAAALAPLSMDDLLRSGVLRATSPGRVASQLRVEPFAGVLIGADARPRSHHVAGLNNAAVLLAQTTVRPTVPRVLDLGTGCGVQALVAVPHGASVFGVDVNPRAVAMATFNAAMNDLDHVVDFRLGSWFDPVESQRFDLIVVNPPFVMSPDRHCVFRDSPQRGDALGRMLLRSASRHLDAGGYAVMLCNWACTPEDSLAPIERWLEGIDADAVVVHYATDTTSRYARRWNGHLDPGSDEFRAAVERWTRYLRGAGISAVAYGVVTIRRRPEGPWWRVGIPVTQPPSGFAGNQMLRIFQARDVLARMTDDRSVLSLVFRTVDGQTAARTPLHRGGGFAHGPVRIGVVPGLGVTRTVEPAVFAVLCRCDGHRPLGDLVRETSRQLSLDEWTLAAHTIPAVKGLLGDGLLSCGT
ncbi:MAG: methyltransferase [Acidimicrobiia bacterium]